MKTKKKMLLATIAMLLVCAVSVTGTLAYLTSTANGGNAVTNTFIAAGGGDLIGTDTNGNKGEFVLKEHKVQTNASGAYEYAKQEGKLIEVEGNDYAVLPGVDLPKDPFVRITGKSEAPAYLYVKVESGISDEDALSYEMAECWQPVTGVDGVYVYSDSKEKTPIAVTSDLTVNILKDNVIKVANADDLGLDEEIELTFYGYLAQASITTTEGTSSDAAVIYNTCFGSNQSAD
jgi:predicted ribosomally synthesized peptide with SipW-like signal peptide